MTRSQYFIGYLLAILAALGFSSKAIFVKLAYQDQVDAVNLLALRMAYSLIFFALTALHHYRNKQSPPITRQQGAAIILLGVLGYYLSSLFDFIGLQYISASLERLILFLYPTLVVILSAIFLNHPTGRREILALTLSYTGIAVVFGGESQWQNEQFWQGSLWIFGSTLSYSLYLIGTGEIVKSVGASRFTAYAMLVACAATLLHFSVTHPWSDVQQPFRVQFLALMMAIFSTVVPVFMLSSAIQRIGSSRTSLIGSLGPVSTLFLAVYVLGEQLGAQQIIGALLVLLGVFSLSRK
jgi:drug/metabolite transporter (DMT)-like permease